MQQNGGDTFPRPDPTVLTTEALRRDLLAQRELFESELRTRDVQIQLLLEEMRVKPGSVRRAVDALQELQDQKFRAIDQRFAESKVALDTAMAAAKEAAGKTEMSLTKQLDSMQALVGTTTNALSDKIDDAKGRLTLIEGRGSGFQSSWVILLGALGGLGTIAGLIALIIALANR